MTFDLIVRGGTIHDGSGLPGYRADVGVADGMIAGIGDLGGEGTKETIDAEGHIVYFFEMSQAKSIKCK